VLAEARRFVRALDHRRELWAADTRHHASGAHRPWADPDLDDVGAGVDELSSAGGGHHVAGDDRRVGACGANGLDDLEHPRLMTVRGVDDERVDTHRHERRRATDGVGVDADRHGDEQLTLSVDCRPVDGGSQGPGAGEQAEQLAVGVDDRGEGPARPVQPVERLLGRDVRWKGVELGAHHMTELREPVETDCVVLGEHAERAILVVDDDHGAVCALVDEAERVADRARRPERDRRLEKRMAGLDPPDHLLDHVERDVLREHGEAAAARGHLGHPATGDGGHVGDDERDRRADAVGRREVDAEPAPDIGVAGHHEHVAVGQVVSGGGLQHAHVWCVSLAGTAPRPRSQIGRHRLTAPAVAYADRVVSDPDPADTPPVVLVHGWGGSFATTWERSGFTMLLQEAGRTVIGVDLLGHGTAPKPHDPEAYTDLTARVLEAMPDQPVDAIGFSLGAMTLLRLAMRRPERFRRLVLAGIGRNVFEVDVESTRRIIDAIEGGDSVDNRARLFAQYASDPTNDSVALAAILKRPPAGPPSDDELAAVTCPVLVAVGDDDFVQPADRLVAALPDATYRELRRTDHFATPESFAFVDAALEFIGAVPA
jgi:pimeloyl-ACP methyl ester carboxylesterase